MVWTRLTYLVKLLIVILLHLLAYCCWMFWSYYLLTNWLTYELILRLYKSYYKINRSIFDIKLYLVKDIENWYGSY